MNIFFVNINVDMLSMVEFDFFLIIFLSLVTRKYFEWFYIMKFFVFIIIISVKIYKGI